MLLMLNDSSIAVDELNRPVSTSTVISACWKLMQHVLKICGARIRTHDLWTRKRVCCPLHHSAPVHSPQSDLKLVHLVFMSARAQLSSDIGLTSRKLIEITCFSQVRFVSDYSVVSYFYVHKQSSSLIQSVYWPRWTIKRTRADVYA